MADEGADGKCGREGDTGGSKVWGPALGLLEDMADEDERLNSGELGYRHQLFGGVWGCRSSGPR